MKTIVFIGTNKSGSSREAIRAAEALGYYTVVLTDQTRFLEKRAEFPDIHLMKLADLANLIELRQEIQRLKLKALDLMAIVSFIEPHCYTASLLAQEFQLNHFGSEAIANMQNKIVSRKLISNSIYSPKYVVLTGEEQLEDYQTHVKKLMPAVIKAPKSSGSKDVILVRNYQEFVECVQKLTKKHPQIPILAEEYLDGPQYLVEVVVCEQNVHLVAVFKQAIKHEKRFIITGYDLLLDLPEQFYQSLEQAVIYIVRTHGLESGGCHLELRYVGGDWKLIEINPRISGGAMNKLIEIGLGINLVQETLQILLGQTPDLEPKHQIHTYAKYVTITRAGVLKRVTGKKRARKSPGVREVYIKPRKGTLLFPPLSMGHRYAYVIATGGNELEAKANAKAAADQIEFQLFTPQEEDCEK